MRTQSLKPWVGGLVIIVVLGGFVTWLALPWIKSAPAEDAGRVPVATPDHLPKDADAWWMLMRQAEMPPGWVESPAAYDLPAVRDCRPKQPGGRIGYADTEWAWVTSQANGANDEHVLETISIFGTENQATSYTALLEPERRCVAEAFNGGHGDYTEDYTRVHISNASVSELKTQRYGSYTLGETLEYEVSESGSVAHFYDDVIVMRQQDVVYTVSLQSRSTRDDALVGEFAEKATEKIGLPLPEALSAPGTP